MSAPRGLALPLAAFVAVVPIVMPAVALAQQSDATSSTQPTATDEPAGGGTAHVSTEAHAAHTSSATTTRSGAAPTSTGPDGATAPVIDPVTAPPARGAAAEEEEEEEGDGRDVDYLWIEAQGGISNVNLVQFQNQNFADVAAGAPVFSEVYGTGPAVGAGVGFRLWWIAVGARMSFASYDTFQVGTIGGEVTLRLPVPVVEPWVRVGFGYGWQGEASYAAGTTSHQTTTYGWTFQSGVGVDIYLVNWLTIGAGFGLDILNMTRQRDPSATCMGLTDVCPMQNGDALGLQLKGLATVGLRF